MVCGELTGALYKVNRASDKFQRQPSSSAGRSRVDDVPTLCSPICLGCHAVYLLRRNSLVVCFRGRPLSTTSCCVEVYSTKDFWLSHRSGSRSPQRSSSRHRGQRSHRCCARQQRSEIFDSRPHGWLDAGRGRPEPSAYDRPPGPQGVNRLGSFLRCMVVDIILPHLGIQLSTGNILSFVVPSLGRDAF